MLAVDSTLNRSPGRDAADVAHLTEIFPVAMFLVCCAPCTLDGHNPTTWCPQTARPQTPATHTRQCNSRIFTLKDHGKQVAIVAGQKSFNGHLMPSVFPPPDSQTLITPLAAAL